MENNYLALKTRRIRKRAIVLSAVWITLLLAMLTFLSTL